MYIQDVALDIEQSLANLKSLKMSALPLALRGLRHLPLGDYEPRVSIRYWNGKQHRKVRKDADASYFDPDYCEVVISFVPSEDRDHDTTVMVCAALSGRQGRNGAQRDAVHRASGVTHTVGRRAPPFGSRPGARPRRRGPQP